MKALIVLAVTILVGCGESKPSRPAAVSAESAETLDLYVAAFEKLATDISAEGMTCTKALGIAKTDGAEVAALAGRGASLREAMKAAGKDAAARDWYIETYEGRVKKAFFKMGTMVALCKDDPMLKLALSAVMDQLPMMKKKL